MFNLFKQIWREVKWRRTFLKENYRSVSELPPAKIVQIVKELAPVKILCNGICLYDDTIGEATPEDYARALEELNCFESDVVYKMYIQIVDGHHSIISMFTRKRFW